ncbi:MAG TPA: hypothetical protein VFS21_37265 [Roseiflexaceae bacterium]|nr:hypothetical protein [Roseiflexaceae bacterium]
MATAGGELRQQIERALAEHSERGALLRALSELAVAPGFRSLAAHWAPALYSRDAVFFENFLVRYLDAGVSDAVIDDLLRRAEADGRDSLFGGLYRKVATEQRWDQEIGTLAATDLPDDAVLRAVRRRLFKGIWFGLKEQTALTLYRRSPALFGPLIAQRVRRSWQHKDTFANLRAEMQERGDGALALAVFRAVADERMWANEVRTLLVRQVPPDQILAALRERHPAHVWQFDGKLLARLVGRYGAATLPYLEHDALRWLRNGREELLDAVRAAGGEAAYWRLFLRIGGVAQWNSALRALLREPLDDAALLHALQLRTPTDRSRWWALDSDVALELYRRLPAAARPLIERFVSDPKPELWSAATSAGDEDLLDALCFRAMVNSEPLVWRVFLRKDRHGQPLSDPAAARQLQQVSAPALARLDRLGAESPERFVRHAAAILGYLAPFQIWSFGRSRSHNPVLAALVERHRDAWLAAPEPVRELLESTNIVVQILGLELLAQGGPDAARRTVECLPLLRALLLGRARKGTKRLVLTCLEQAARQDPAGAEAALPLLAEASEVRGRRAVDLHAMVTLVRLRHAAEVG